MPASSSAGIISHKWKTNFCATVKHIQAGSQSCQPTGLSGLSFRRVACESQTELESRLETRRFAYLHLMKLKFGVCFFLVVCLPPEAVASCRLPVASWDLVAAYACGTKIMKNFKRIALSHRCCSVATLQRWRLWHERNFYNLLTSRSTAPRDCLQLWQVDKRLNPNLFSQTPRTRLWHKLRDFVAATVAAAAAAMSWHLNQ